METPSTFEAVVAGILVALVILWFRPGLKAAMERSRKAEKDWPAVLLPLGLVVLFVILLIALARS